MWQICKLLSQTKHDLNWRRAKRSTRGRREICHWTDYCLLGCFARLKEEKWAEHYTLIFLFVWIYIYIHTIYILFFLKKQWVFNEYSAYHVCPPMRRCMLCVAIGDDLALRGLNIYTASDNMSYIQSGDRLLILLEACPPGELQTYEWWKVCSECKYLIHVEGLPFCSLKGGGLLIVILAFLGKGEGDVKERENKWEAFVMSFLENTGTVNRGY